MFSGLHRFLPLFLVAATIIPCMAQQSDTAAPIAGRVVRADTGAPISGATVTLSPPFYEGAGPFFQTAVTDRSGNYSFPAAPNGDVIAATADGFTWPQLSVEAAARLSGINFRLVPEAVIRGSVVTADGHPVAGLPVTAVRREPQTPDGKMSIQRRAITGADGTFVLNKLTAGTYYVAVNGPNEWLGIQKSGTWYRETWYGNRPSADGATELTLSEGGERSGIAIAVEPEARYTVTIWPSGPEAEPADRYMVSVKGHGTQSSGSHNGSYTIVNVPPGHYTLTTDAYRGGKLVGTKGTIFDVTNADVALQVEVEERNPAQSPGR